MKINRQTEDAIYTILKTIRKSRGESEDVPPEEILAFVEDAIRRRTDIYMTRSGELKFEPAMIKWHKFTGEDREEYEVNEGFAIEPCTMFGRDYYKVIVNGSPMKVPAEDVIFTKKEENQ